MAYSWDCSSEVHLDVWLNTGAKGVAPDQINGCWRGHVKLSLCDFGHQEKRNLNCTRQPRQIAYLSTE